jgi:hypothetical protein
MRSFILLSFGMALATSAFAVPSSCVSGTYASYVALSTTGCQDGDGTFSNFSALGFTNSGGVAEVSDTDIMVTPGGTALNPTLTFEYINSAGTATPVTVDESGQIFSMGLTYSLVLTGATLSDIQMGETFSNTSPGSVSATKNAEIGSGTTFSSTVSDGGLNNPTGTTSTGNVTPTTGTGTWNITDTVSLQAQSGSATQNSFENLFTLAAAGPNSTAPELPTGAMIGSALLLFGLISRRFRKSTEA